MDILMTQAYLQSLQPPHGYDKLLSLIIWLSILREGSRRLVLLPFQRYNTDGQPDRQIDGDTWAIYCGEADNDTIAQVVKCTPVIVLHQADEITLFRWHSPCPCSAGAPWKMTCFVFLTSPHPHPLPMMPFTTSGLRDGFKRPVSMTTSHECSQKDQICFLRHHASCEIVHLIGTRVLFFPHFFQLSFGSSAVSECCLCVAMLGGPGSAEKKRSEKFLFYLYLGGTRWLCNAPQSFLVLNNHIHCRVSSFTF